MKTRLARIAIVFLAGVSLASAQPGNWSPLQQEVINHLHDRMNAWVELAKTGDFDTYFARCPLAPGAAYWVTDAGTPAVDLVASLRRRIGLLKEERAQWLDMVPITITVHENVAVAHFYAYWQTTREGKRDAGEYKATETFRKVGSKWIFLGGQLTPVEKPTSAR